MHKFAPFSAALILAVSVSPLVLAQGQGQGQGKGQGQAQSQGQNQGQGQGQGQDRGNAPDRSQAERGSPADRGPNNRPAGVPDNRAERAVERTRDRDLAQAQRAPLPGEPIVLRRRADRGLIEGCPPGLAKRDNGCLPPGQERRLERARYQHLLGERGARYEDGYLYRFNPQGALLGYVPVLGGALARGAEWPERYGYEAAPDYLASYFGLNRDRYDYRYADGALYGVDPQTRQIAQVAALLTGQDWAIGQPAPTGYDVYNVPYQYRDQYRDTAEARYRYSDGQVYQIDPTTRLVQAVFQLLT